MLLVTKKLLEAKKDEQKLKKYLKFVSLGLTNCWKSH